MDLSPLRRVSLSLGILILFAASAVLGQASSSSANYSILHQSLDGGGKRASVSLYSNDGAFTGFGGRQTAGGSIVSWLGHVGQLSGDVPAATAQGMDTDGDRLPDDYEAAYNLNPNDAQDSGLDSDGDGFTNLEEFIAGTNPQNSESAFRITSTEEGAAGLSTQFTSVLGKQYRLEANGSFPATDGWEAIGPNWDGTGNSLEGVDAMAANLEKCIYRVRVLGGSQPDVLSKPSGFYRLGLLGNSDTVVSMPFARPEAASGLVLLVSDNVVTVKGASAWTVNQWVYAAGLQVQTNTHYLLVRSGAKEGQYHPITGNGENSVTLDLEGQSLAGLNSGDRVAIIPYWTLGSVFPSGRGIHASPTPGNRLTEILAPDMGAAGINLSAGSTYYFWDGNWRQVGQGSAVKNDEVLLPDAYFIVRHNLATPTALTGRGSVLTTKWRVPLLSHSSGKQDNVVALPRPVAATLNASGLIESGAFSASPTPGNRTDELLVFDNATAAKNKSAAATYYYWSGAWRKVGAGDADMGNEIAFAPGAGVIIRKNAGTGPVLWLNSPNY